MTEGRSTSERGVTRPQARIYLVLMCKSRFTAHSQL